MLTVAELLERETFFDAAIYRHGFVDYMRDYELVVGGRDGPPHTDVHRYLFVGCAEAHYETAIRPEAFAKSLPDDFVLSGPDYPDKDDPDGFIWGVRYSNAYPGLTFVPNGERARDWAARLGRFMHEVLIRTEAFHLRLVFADLRYAPLGTLESPGAMRPADMPIPPAENQHTTDGNVR